VRSNVSVIVNVESSAFLLMGMERGGGRRGFYIYIRKKQRRVFHVHVCSSLSFIQILHEPQEHPSGRRGIQK
jgi:hypothetical protein